MNFNLYILLLPNLYLFGDTIHRRGRLFSLFNNKILRRQRLFYLGLVEICIYYYFIFYSNIFYILLRTSHKFAQIYYK